MNRAGSGGEIKWKTSLPKFVKGKIIVIKKVKREIAIRGKLGPLAFKKKPLVLIENIRTISVKILSINQRVLKRAGWLL